MDIIKNIVGKDINITDSNGDRLVHVELQGDTYQYTTTGKNLLKNTNVDSGDYNYWSSYSTFNADTTELTRSTTATTESFIAHRKSLKANTTYTLSLYAKSNGYVSSMDFQCYNSSYQGIVSKTDMSLTTSYQKYTWTFTTANNVDYTTGVLRIDNNGSTTSGTEAILTVKNVMLVEGTDTDYEPYTNGASPNPDYPQAVQTVTGRQTIDDVGKNLYDISKSITGYINGAGGITTTDPSNLLTTYISVKSNQKYTISVNTQFSNLGYAYFDNNKTYVSRQNNNNKTNITITIPNNVSYLRVWFNLNGSTALTPENIIQYQPMIEQSETPTTYEPYKGQSYEINLGKNLFDKDNAEVGNGYINNDGNFAPSPANKCILSYTEIKPNTQYTLVYNGLYRIILYNSNKTKIIAYPNITSPYTFTTTSDTKYIRISGDINIDLDTIQLETGSKPSTYAPYKTPIELCKIGDYKDFIRKGTGKNLFDKDNANVLNVWFNTSQTTIVANDSTKTIYIPCKSNATYTVSKISSARFCVGYTTTIPTTGVTANGIIQNNSATSITITTGNDAKYLCVFYYHSSYDTSITSDNILSTIMIEQNSSATLYEPYGYANKWYMYKAIGKIVLNGSENWGLASAGDVFYIAQSDVLQIASTITTIATHLEGYYNQPSANNVHNYNHDNSICASSSGTKRFYIKCTQFTTVADFKTWLSTHNTSVYYVLETPTIEDITDSELIEQLNNLNNALLPYETVYISTESNDLNATLDVDYFCWNRYISPTDRQALLNGSATIPYKINVIKDGAIVKTLDEYSIIDTSYEDFRYVDTSSLVIGQFVARKFTGKLDKIYTDFEIEDTELNIQMGVKIANNETTYYDLGNFLVTQPKTDDVKDKTDFEAMDYTKKFNKIFDGETLTYPCTAQDLAIECCRQAGVELATPIFDNYNFIVNNNQYVENDTCRKVMQDIGKLAYSWVRIDWDNKCYLDFDPQDYILDCNKIDNSKYYSLTLQKEVFGPVNRVVIGMENVEGENAIIEDVDSIEEYGVTEIQLYDNNLTYTPDLRQQVIQSASKLFGLMYTPLETSTVGHPWLIGKEKVQVTTMENDVIYTYPFDRSIEYKGHIKTKITSKADTKTETEYRNDGTLETEMRKTRIIVDKNSGNITSLTTRTSALETETGNMYTKEQVNSLVQNAETGLTNTFSEAGGNNIFRNTGLWFEQSGGETKTGKNLFDGQLETGAYNTSTGAKQNDNNMKRNANPIYVESNKTYIISNNGSGVAMNVLQYKSDDTFIQHNTISSGNSFTTTSNTAYINIYRGSSNTDKLQVENGSTISSYEPYYSYTNNFEFWEGPVVKQKEEKASNMNALLLQLGNLYQEQDVPNGTYTVSFKYKKLIELSNPKVIINDVSYNLTETEDTEFLQVIEVSSQHINIKFSNDINNGCEVYDLMVNAGTVKLAYSQNQNETTTDTVNISKGITITSTDLDVTFKANADGIRTLDKNNNELTKFTDTGMTTKEAIIESKSQIVGTLWQEVGGQTWITRL